METRPFFKKGTVILFVLVVLFRVQTATCLDTVRFHMQHFTDENGLPQNSVKFITMDKAGFLWMATENGLVRYGGNQQFAIFGKHELGISSSRMSTLYPTQNNNEFCAITESHQVIHISRGKAIVQHGVNAREDQYHEMIYREDTAAYLITGLPNIYEKDTKTIRYLIQGGAGNETYFMISPDSVSLIKNGKPQYKQLFHYSRPWNFFPLDGQLYYIGETGEVTGFYAGKVKTVALTGDILACPAYKTRHPGIKLYWNFSAGQLFIYLNNYCYAVTHRPDGSLYTHLVVQDFDFLANRIMSVYYDAVHKRLYLGSFTKGLYVFTQQPFYVLSEREQNDDVYYAHARVGTNYILTAQGVLFDSAGRSSIVAAIRARHITADRYSLVTDKSGNIWYKNDRMLYKFSPEGQPLWQWESPSVITQLYTEIDNCLWVATKTEGLFVLSMAAQATPELFSQQLTDVTCLRYEAPDLLWLGSSKGLYRMHLSSRRIDTIPDFENKNVRSLTIPRAGEVWITTYDDGFFLYRYNQLTTFPHDQRKYLQTSHCIVFDDSGYCWISTNKGLFQAARKDLLAYADKQQSYVYYQYYGKDRGFNTNEFNGGCQPCAVKWDNGNISLPSMDGLVYFSPDHINPEVPDREMYIDQIALNGAPMLYRDTLTLPHEFKHLKLDVSVPYFGDAYNLQMTYMLEAVAEEGNAVWLPLGNDHTLSFSTLPSGTYRLHIRKINGFGENNYTDKILIIDVPQAYYETIWFRLLIALLLAIIIAIYTRLRTYQVKRKNRLLESRVAERTTALEATMASLTASENKLRRQTRTQERLIASITHDIKTPMKYLMILAGNMRMDMTKMEPEMIAKSSKAIYDTSYRMYYLLDNLIQYIRTHIKNGSASPEEIDLHELLEEKIDIFFSIAQSRFVNVENNVPPDLQFLANYQVLGVVLHNLLDNAVKNTAAGSIRLAAMHTGEKVLITVEDTGPGLPSPVLEWINKYQGLNGKADEASPVQSGIGLLIVMEMLELLNGKLTAVNKQEKGTIIKIELPVLS